jgi:uncharacterized protein
METSLFRYNPWWEQLPNFDLVHRDGYEKLMAEALQNDQIILLTGLRRIGKTSLMRLTIEKLILQKQVGPTRILYVSLDDYNLKNLSILAIVDEFRKIHKIKFTEKIYLFLDEVTYQHDFAVQLKNLSDSHHVKIFAASSSSSLLVDSKHYMTGRNKVVEVLPLDFNEYLQFKNVTISKADNPLLEAKFENFLQTGGIPQYVKTGDPSYIHELVDDIIMKDIAAQNGIRQTKVLKDLFVLLMERAGKQVSLNKLAALLGTSVDSVSRYVDLFRKAYLIYTIDRHGKTNERLLSPKKVYAPDTGIRVHYTGLRDKGSLFENYVFLKIKSYQPTYLYQNQTELDFVLNNGHVVEAKFHNEPLSEKQQLLMEAFAPAKRHIVRSEKDLTDLGEQF